MLRGRELLLLLLARHHTVGVDHQTCRTQAVVEVVGVEGGDVLPGQLVGRPLGRVVQHLVHVVVPSIELEGGVNTVQVVEQVQGVNVAEAKLVRCHYIVKVCLDVSIDHLLKQMRIRVQRS